MIHILLPAYDEEEGLEYLLNRIRRIGESFALSYRVVIVDDGSRDHTGLVIRSYAHEMPIEVIRFECNAGIEAVFSAGFRKVCAEASDEDICVTMDSDNTQNPYVMLDMLKAMEGPGAPDIVIASRFEKGGAMVGAPFVRKILSIAVSRLLRWTVPVGAVKDYSTFYRAYRVRAVKKGFAVYGDDLIRGHGFSAMARMLIKLSTVTGRIAEVPFILRYDLKEGGTGMKIGKTMFGYLNIIAEHYRNPRRGA